MPFYRLGARFAKPISHTCSGTIQFTFAVKTNHGRLCGGPPTKECRCVRVKPVCSLLISDQWKEVFRINSSLRGNLNALLHSSWEVLSQGTYAVGSRDSCKTVGLQQHHKSSCSCVVQSLPYLLRQACCSTHSWRKSTCLPLSWCIILLKCQHRKCKITVKASHYQHSKHFKTLISDSQKFEDDFKTFSPGAENQSCSGET